MTDTLPSPRHLRRIVMILVAAGTLLALLFCCFWFVLPHWAPGVVIRWSPWAEPVVNAGAHLHARGGTLGDLGWDYQERFAE